MRQSVSSFHLEKGFTLVEILVALTIFSIIALASFRLLSSTALFVSLNESKQIQRLERERAIAIVVNDLLHAVVLPISSGLEGEEKQPDNQSVVAMSGRSNNFELTFNRSDYFHMASEFEQKNVQIRYELRPSEGTGAAGNLSTEPYGEELIRTVSYTASSDQQQSFSRTQVLLPQVGDVNLRFLNDNDQWTEQWPLTQESQSDSSVPPSSVFVGFDESLPQAVEMVLELGDQRVRKLIGLRS